MRSFGFTETGSIIADLRRVAATVDDGNPVDLYIDPDKWALAFIQADHPRIERRRGMRSFKLGNANIVEDMPKLTARQRASLN